MNGHDFYVSIVVPNYCHAKYLDQRIQSILDQTYENFELIILDDKSPDEGASRAVIEKYRGNPHVSHIVYNEENSGSTFKQWNKGFSLAKGELIWIAESDDYCEKNFLERLVTEFQNDNQLSLAFCRSQKVDSLGRPIVVHSLDLFKDQHLAGVDFIKKFMLMGNFCNNASACLLKKEIATNVDPLYTTFKASGDAMFWIEIAERGNVAVIGDRLNYFRQHENKVTPQKTLMGVNNREYKIIYDYLCERIHLNAKQRALMLACQQKRILERKFADENIRKNLLALWGLDDRMSFFMKLKVKFILTMQHRLGIF